MQSCEVYHSRIRGCVCGYLTVQWGKQHFEVPFLGLAMGTWLTVLLSEHWSLKSVYTLRLLLLLKGHTQLLDNSLDHVLSNMSCVYFHSDVLRCWKPTPKSPPQESHINLEHWIQQSLCLSPAVLSFSIHLFNWGGGWVSSLLVPSPNATIAEAVMVPKLEAENSVHVFFLIGWSHCHFLPGSLWQEAGRRAGARHKSQHGDLGKAALTCVLIVQGPPVLKAHSNHESWLSRGAMEFLICIETQAIFF